MRRPDIAADRLPARAPKGTEISRAHAGDSGAEPPVPADLLPPACDLQRRFDGSGLSTSEHSRTRRRQQTSAKGSRFAEARTNRCQQVGDFLAGKWIDRAADDP